VTADSNPPATVTLPAESITRLARLLSYLDEFLRNAPSLPDQLTAFMHHRGDDHPRFTANNLIDEVTFTAAWLQAHAAELRRCSGS
jgi:hypothetical protein